MRVNVVDLFCGVGGLSYGFKKEGFHVKAGVDTDASCKYAFETNVRAQFLARDIRTLPAPNIRKLLDEDEADFRILIGCAPCAPFSLYTGRYRKAKHRDVNRRWQLLAEFLRIILATMPDIVSMENVPRLKGHRIFRQFVSGLRDNGYIVSHFLVRADQYGVPQRRKRLVLFASKFGKVEILPPTHLDKPVTVRDAIGKLPEIEAGSVCPSDHLHVSRRLTEKNLLRITSTREGGSWKDWPNHLQLDCHKKPGGKTFRSVYGRMRWNEVSPVITTQCLGIGNGRFGHPQQHRAISIREAALLQTFPKKFKFVAPSQPIFGAHLARQIGNAVPVRLARMIARTIKHHLDGVLLASAAKRGVKSRLQQKKHR
jgi:DNA (cytosine-5)-methyltransferase 1